MREFLSRHHQYRVLQRKPRALTTWKQEPLLKLLRQMVHGYYHNWFIIYPQILIVVRHPVFLKRQRYCCSCATVAGDIGEHSTANEKKCDIDAICGC